MPGFRHGGGVELELELALGSEGRGAEEMTVPEKSEPTTRPVEPIGEDT